LFSRLPPVFILQESRILSGPIFGGQAIQISEGLKIDESLVEIRDAIAHGRVFLSAPDGINQLLRFRKPKNNEVEVEFSVAMTEEWFTTQFLRFYDAVRMVDTVHKRQDAGY